MLSKIAVTAHETSLSRFRYALGANSTDGMRLSVSPHIRSPFCSRERHTRFGFATSRIERFR